MKLYFRTEEAAKRYAQEEHPDAYIKRSTSNEFNGECLAFLIEDGAEHLATLVADDAAYEHADLMQRGE